MILITKEKKADSKLPTKTNAVPFATFLREVSRALVTKSFLALYFYFNRINIL